MNNLSKEVCAWQFFPQKHIFFGKACIFLKKTVFLEKTQTFFLNTIVFIEKNTFLVKLYGIEV